MSRIMIAIALIVAAMAQGAAFGQGVGWDIDDYQVEITAGADGELEIVETIAADFTRESHRGIIREIPFSYERNGSRFRMRIEVDGVTDAAGAARPFTQRRDDGRLRIRVGDPDVHHDDVQVYRIAYRVRRGLLRFETHDELYWNAIGAEWPVPIERASAVVRLPEGVDASSARTASYLGPYGSAAPGPEPEEIGAGAIRWVLPDGMGMRTGLTVVVGMPTGAIARASLWTRIGWFLSDNGVLLAPVVVFALLWALWWMRGRDRGALGSVAVRYEPPDGLTPAEAGTLIDERANTRDITATVIDLAVRGYLEIDATASPATGEPEPEEVLLRRTDKDDARLPLFEQRILDALFRKGKSVSLEDLRFDFYSDLSKIKTSLYDALSRRGYTTMNLGMMRGVWMLAGFLAAGGVVAAAFILHKRGFFTPVPLIIAAALCAIQMPIFAYFMPRKTAKGRRALERVRGLEEYIRRAAVDEIEAKAREAHFEQLLPYAMAFGLSNRWARAFEGLYEQSPSWYRSPRTGAWSTVWMVHSLSHSTSALASSMTAQPRSSGSGGSSFGSGGSGFSGGFSGGGGGGGGGGAW